jgi:hypothetical protein
MKQLFLSLLLSCASLIASAAPLGSAFTYQALLNTTNGPANGTYDLSFAIFPASSGGIQVGSTLTLAAVPITNGQFAATLDFGSGIFNGIPLWLQIGARTNGAASFTTLARQRLLPVPYAIFANTASNLSGALGSGQLTGVMSDAQLSANIPRLNSSATFAGTVTAIGFSGPGGGLTSLNASQLTGGVLPSAQLSGTYSSPVTINNGADVFSGGGLTIAASRAGNFLSPVVKFENTSSGPSNAPALRVVNNGGTNGDGALSVSANVQPGLPTGLIAQFGNSLSFVATITNDGTIYANGFVGNGSLPWQVSGGTLVQAAPDNGYLLTSAQQASVILPASPTVGDIIRVTGVTPGGWKITQNSGQSVLGNFLSGQVGTDWTPTASGSRSWESVASSADGSKLIAGAGSSRIYTSPDGGVTWVTNNSPIGSWNGVCISTDGTKAAAVNAGVVAGQIYTSTDSGVNWTPRASAQLWSSITSSSDGTHLAATSNGSGNGGQISVSTDSGVSWNPYGITTNWNSVACSADGTKLIAAAAGNHSQGGFLYTSSNSGVTWTPHPEAAQNWTAVASSVDGSKLVAVAGGPVEAEFVWISHDSGASWILTNDAPQAGWTSVASSADGNRLVAGTSSGRLYISTNAGVNWVTTAPNAGALSWSGVASSADGLNLVAGANGGQIWTWQPVPATLTTVGSAGALTGGQAAVTELQYLGNNRFMQLRHEGAILAY